MAVIIARRIFRDLLARRYIDGDECKVLDDVESWLKTHGGWFSDPQLNYDSPGPVDGGEDVMTANPHVAMAEARKLMIDLAGALPVEFEERTAIRDWIVEMRERESDGHCRVCKKRGGNIDLEGCICDDCLFKDDENSDEGHCRICNQTCAGTIDLEGRICDDCLYKDEVSSDEDPCGGVECARGHIFIVGGKRPLSSRCRAEERSRRAEGRSRSPRRAPPYPPYRGPAFRVNTASSDELQPLWELPSEMLLNLQYYQTHKDCQMAGNLQELQYFLSDPRRRRVVWTYRQENHPEPLASLARITELESRIRNLEGENASLRQDLEAMTEAAAARIVETTRNRPAPSSSGYFNGQAHRLA